MCGIAAIIDPAGRARLADVVAMSDVVRHRGPDSEGFVVADGDAVDRFDGPATPEPTRRSGTAFAPTATAATAADSAGWAALGHRRLSIIDVSPTGHQPMSDATGRYWVVLNGEIYNFVELRSELESRGHRFAGHSDTEVLLAAFAEWGPGCLDRLVGMFAFVLLDVRKRRVLIARDRFGIKPLYLWRTRDGALAVASEIKQFSVLEGWSPRLDGRRAFDFLNYGITDHTAMTLFAGVRQLRGGEMVDAPLAALATGLPVRRWWSLAPGRFDGTFDEAAERFRDLFRRSVAQHLRSDVPVGSCLSGGLDSSSLVCEAHRQLALTGNAPTQHAFSATSDDPAVDESRWMRIVADATDVTITSRTPDLEAIPALLPTLAWHMDEPFLSTSVLAQWTVFSLAAQRSVTVLLDGQGADEQLAGYEYYFAWRFQELLRRGRIPSLARDVAATRRRHHEATRSLVMMSAYLSVPAQLARAGGRLVRAPGQDPGAWLDLDRLGVTGREDPIRDAGGRVRSVRGLSLAQLTATNLPMLLRYEDRDSMAHSIEARVPFLDHRLVEFVVSLPGDFLIADGVTKRVLREAMRGVLPEPIRRRMDKIGFQTAEERWLRHERPEVALGLLRRAVEVSDGVLRPATLVRGSEVVDGRRPFDSSVWRQVSFGAWIEAFGVSVGA